MTTRAEIREAIVDHMSSVAGPEDKLLLDEMKESGGNIAFADLNAFDSLDAVDLCMALDTRFGVDVDLAEFARVSDLDGFADRVAAIAGITGEEIRSLPVDDLGPHLICLQPGEPGRTPLFLVAGGDGSNYSFRHVVAALDDSIPVYGLKLYGIDGLAMPLLDAQDVAAFLADTIRQLQPGGPIAIMGFSLGGMLAFETACTLSAQATAPTHVLMLDTNCPVQPQKTRPATERLLESRFWTKVLGLKWLERRIRRRRNARAGAAQQAQFEAHAAPGEPVPLNLRESYFNTASRIMHANYRPSRYAGPVTLFRATKRYRRAKDDNATLGWQAHCDNDIRVIPVETNHFNILKPKQAGEIAVHIPGLLAVPGTAKLQAVDPAPEVDLAKSGSQRR